MLLLLVGLEISQRVWRSLPEGGMSLPIGGEIFRHMIVAAGGFVAVVLPLVALEQLYSTSRPSLRSYATGLVGWAPAWALGYFVGLLSQKSVAWLGITPLLVVDTAHQGALVVAALVFLNIFIFDFFYYWFHRTQHAVPILWRLHAVHHSITDLNSVSSFHHPLEELMRIAPITLPLAMLVHFDGAPVIPVFSAFIGAWGQFIHTDTKLNLGSGHLILSDSHYHRIHHSLRPEHFDKNFAGCFPFWDWLFSTIHLPEGEYPEVGLRERPHGPSLRDYFFGIAFLRPGRNRGTAAGNNAPDAPYPETES